MKELKLWIARTEVEYTEDNEHYLERHPENEYMYTKLLICFDKPVANGNHVTDWQSFRKMAEAPNYMFQEIEPGTFMEFSTLTNKREEFLKFLDSFKDNEPVCGGFSL